MNIENLRYYIATVDEMNFSKAAKKLYISQQSLSKHITNLEKEYGTELFLRKRGKEVTITEAGKVLYENARQIVDLHSRTEKQINDIKEFQKNEIVIGVPRVRAYYVLPAILEKFYSEFPDVHVRIISGSSAHVSEAMLRGETDIGIGINIKDKGFNSIELTKDKQYVVLHRKLFEKVFTRDEREKMLAQKILPLKAFERCPFVLCESDIWSGRYFQELLEQDPFDANVIIKSDDFMVMFRLCKTGLGASIIAGSLLGYLRDDTGRARSSDLVYFQLAEVENAEASNMFLVTRKGEYISKACQELIKIIKVHFS